MRPLVDGYDELRLRIDRHATGKYHVLASNQLAEASEGFELPFEELEIENFILRLSRPRGRRRIDSSAIDEARQFGGRLFKGLFHGEIHSLYRDTLADARGRGRGVRITLCLSGSPELIDVPWEYLFDDPDFLAMSAFTPVVRYLDLPRAHRPLLVKPPLRLLGVVSSPADYEQLDVARERANLESALADAHRVGRGRAAVARATDAGRPAPGAAGADVPRAALHRARHLRPRYRARGAAVRGRRGLGAPGQRRQARDDLARLLVAAPGDPQRLRGRPDRAHRSVRRRRRVAGAARHPGRRGDAVRDQRRGRDRLRQRLL